MTAGAGRVAVASLVALVTVTLGVLGVGHSTAGLGSSPAARRYHPQFSPELSTASLLRRQTAAVARGDGAAFRAGWAGAPAARRQAARIYDNLRSLGVSGLAARVDEGTVPTTASRWTAAVTLTWSMPGFDRMTVTSDVVYAFVRRGAQAVVVRIRPMPSTRPPVWLIGRLSVRRLPHALVVATTPARARRLDAPVRHAVGAVREVLPGWRGALVIFAPTTSRQFDALLNVSPGAYDGIAAVTATIDGADRAATPSVVVLNPPSFAGLGRVGAAVVVTHEATHVATSAATTSASATSMPVWLVEGFADYVALGSVHAPMPVADRDAVLLARRAGPPRALPADAAFEARGPRLQAAYEQAWLANLLIARRYGQGTLIAFYRQVEAAPHQVGAAFRRVLHTTPDAFTAAWSAYVGRLAR